MNACIPSEQRATVLSFNSLMGSAGGVVAQPALGRVADVFSFGTAYVVAGVIYAITAAVRRGGAPDGSCGPTPTPGPSRQSCPDLWHHGVVAEQESTQTDPMGPAIIRGIIIGIPVVLVAHDSGDLADHAIGHLRIGTDGSCFPGSCSGPLAVDSPAWR